MIEYKSCPKTYTNLFIEKILTFNNTSTVFDELSASIWDLTEANAKHHRGTYFNIGRSVSC